VDRTSPLLHRTILFLLGRRGRLLLLGRFPRRGGPAGVWVKTRPLRPIQSTHGTHARATTLVFLRPEAAAVIILVDQVACVDGDRAMCLRKHALHLFHARRLVSAAAISSIELLLAPFLFLFFNPHLFKRSSSPMELLWTFFFRISIHTLY